jgi:hypothetical protein
VAGAPQGAVASIAYAAWRLGLRHNSTVELVDRSVAQGLLVRTSNPQDRRRVTLEITVKGRRILKKLSQNHARELRELGPFLIRSLKRIERADRARTRQRADEISPFYSGDREIAASGCPQRRHWRLEPASRACGGLVALHCFGNCCFITTFSSKWCSAGSHSASGFLWYPYWADSSLDSWPGTIRQIRGHGIPEANESILREGRA